MQRIRTVKPDFFKHEDLFDLEQNCGLPIRLSFAGLWTCCDREGRFRWKPRQLKTDILPYDEIDFSRVLDALATRGFVIKYEVNGEEYGYVPTFHKHQHLNPRESVSQIPEPRVSHASVTRQHLASDAPSLPLPYISSPESSLVPGDIEPEMVATGLADALKISVGYGPGSARDAIDEVARAEKRGGRLMIDLAAEMETAWAYYQSEKINLRLTWGAAKFFGEGHWRNPEAWERKNGGLNGKVSTDTLRANRREASFAEAKRILDSGEPTRTGRGSGS